MYLSPLHKNGYSCLSDTTIRSDATDYRQILAYFVVQRLYSTWNAFRLQKHHHPILCRFCTETDFDKNAETCRLKQLSTRLYSN